MIAIQCEPCSGTGQNLFINPEDTVPVLECGICQGTGMVSQSESNEVTQDDGVLAKTESEL